MSKLMFYFVCIIFLSVCLVITGSLSSSAGGDNLGNNHLDTIEDSLRKSSNTQRMLKDSRLKLTDAHNKMRDLSINIRYGYSLCL